MGGLNPSNRGFSGQDSRIDGIISIASPRPPMAEILLTGATGVLGEILQDALADGGYSVRAASRSPPADDRWVHLDLARGTGLESAVEDVDIVVHAASDARGDPQAVDVRGTERLLRAAEAADVGEVLYVSIVGIEDIPYSYYRAKLEAEELVRAAEIPTTIVRSTQFHPFVAYILDRVSVLPVWPLPTRFQLQPIAVQEAADAIVSAIDRHDTIEIGGPRVHSVSELATTYREVRGLRRPIVPIPLPGKIASAFREGAAIRPGSRIGTITWADWLDEQGERPGRGHY